MIKANWLYIKREFKVLISKDYYHQTQGIGKAFYPKGLKGYFNDLTGKTNWKGEVDLEGIPVNVLMDGRKVYFMTTIIQKALGHHDMWLLTKNKKEYEEFIKLSYWLVDKQDNEGGWGIGSILGEESISKYSAMVQGEAISLLVRAWLNKNDNVFRSAAEKALTLLIKPIEDGGVCYFLDSDIFLEEAPTYPRNTILNGWMFALMGLYDYHLAFNNLEIKDLFIRTLSTLKKHLPDYDSGYWSYYDIRKHVSSPFYHNLHIAQLKAINMIEPDEELSYYINKWSKYKESTLNHYRALLLKIYQKLKEPQEVIFIK